MTLIEEYSLADNFSNTGEYRERGVLVKIGLGRELVQNIEAQNPVSHQRYGVIKCLEKNELIYFLTSEVINYVKFVTNGDMVTPTVKASELKVGDSLEFCIVNCSKVIYKSILLYVYLLALSVIFEIFQLDFLSGLSFYRQISWFISIVE